MRNSRNKVGQLMR